MANKVILLGRLVADPEIKYTPSNKVVATFKLAVDRPFKNTNGDRDADFIPCQIWGKAAELIGNSCAKGHRLYIEGRIQVREYTDKEGHRRWATEVVGDKMEFIERKGTPASSGSSSFNQQLDEAAKAAEDAAAQKNSQPSSYDELGEDVPF